jgi:hypothetical protein
MKLLAVTVLLLAEGEYLNRENCDEIQRIDREILHHRKIVISIIDKLLTESISSFRINQYTYDRRIESNFYLNNQNHLSVEK